jgi:hypothetical protein
MFSIEDIKTAVKLLPFPEETKDSIIKNSEIISEFRDFIAKKYTLTQKSADEKIQAEISLRTSNITELELVAQKAEEYAISENYENSSDIGSAIISLSESLSLLKS